MGVCLVDLKESIVTHLQCPDACCAALVVECTLEPHVHRCCVCGLTATVERNAEGLWESVNEEET